MRHNMSKIRACTLAWEFFCKVTIKEWACHLTLDVLHSSKNFSTNLLTRSSFKCLLKFWISLKLKAALEAWFSGSSEFERGPFLLIGLQHKKIIVFIFSFPIFTFKLVCKSKKKYGDKILLKRFLGNWKIAVM